MNFLYNTEQSSVILIRYHVSADIYYHIGRTLLPTMSWSLFIRNNKYHKESWDNQIYKDLVTYDHKSSQLSTLWSEKING